MYQRSTHGLVSFGYPLGDLVWLHPAGQAEVGRWFGLFGVPFVRYFQSLNLWCQHGVCQFQKGLHLKQEVIASLKNICVVCTNRQAYPLWQKCINGAYNRLGFKVTVLLQDKDIYLPVLIFAFTASRLSRRHQKDSLRPVMRHLRHDNWFKTRLLECVRIFTALHSTDVSRRCVRASCVIAISIVPFFPTYAGSSCGLDYVTWFARFSNDANMVDVGFWSSLTHCCIE